VRSGTHGNAACLGTHSCSAFMAVGAKHKCTVGEVESGHKAEVSKLIEEMAAAGGGCCLLHNARSYGPLPPQRGVQRQGSAAVCRNGAVAGLRQAPHRVGGAPPAPTKKAHPLAARAWPPLQAAGSWASPWTQAWWSA